MSYKKINGKILCGIILYAAALASSAYGYYQLRDYGQQSVQELVLPYEATQVVIFPYQATALMIVALIMAIIGSTLILMGKGDQIMNQRSSEEPEEEGFSTEKERDKAEEDQTDEKISRMDRIIL